MTEQSRYELRRGLWPLCTDDDLADLLGAVERDDHRLIQRATTNQGDAPCPVEQACLFGWIIWQSLLREEPTDIPTVGEINEAFSDLCRKVDELLDETGGCRWILNPYDDWPRATMLQILREEVLLEQGRRAANGRNGT